MNILLGFAPYIAFFLFMQVAAGYEAGLAASQPQRRVGDVRGKAG
jgi:hypothetical protein